MSDLNLTIRRQVQNRHIVGTKEYIQYVEKLSPYGLLPSILAEGVDVQDLVNKFHGKGISDPNPRDNSPREIVDAKEFIGQYWDIEENKYVDTTFFEIIYSKRGTHVYPVRPKQGDD